MTTVSISELKAKLSAFLDIVRHGDDVLVTDRGRVIARLAAVTGELLGDSRRELLVRTGRLRPPAALLPTAAWDVPRPRDSEGRSLAGLLDERREGW